MSVSRLAMAAARPLTLDEHKKQILALVRDTAAGSGLRDADVFYDWLELSAISFSNAVDLAQHAAREERYLQIAKRYEASQMARFPKMLAHLVEAMELETSDVLGSMFMGLELGDEWRGQFFTPYPVCLMLAEIALADVSSDTLAERGGFITLQEPAAGAGGMILAAAESLRAKGLNPQAMLCVEAIDIAAPCVWMTYLQLSLLHIPACVVHGNALSLEVRSRWYTPAYVLGFWRNRLKRRAEALPSLTPLRTVELPPMTSLTPVTAAAPCSTTDAPQLTLF